MRNDELLKSMHVAVYALSLLGGAHGKIHTEHVAQECLKISPDRFKWELFDYPDKERVRKALFHASERKNGSLVTGRSGIEQRGKSRDGWQLTPAGAIWLSQHESQLQALIRSGSATIPKREAKRFISRIRSEAAFQIFLSTGGVEGVSPYMFTDLLNCSPDAPAATVRAKFDRLCSNAQLVMDTQVLQFLALCRSQFANMVTAAE